MNWYFIIIFIIWIKKKTDYDNWNLIPKKEEGDEEKQRQECFISSLIIIGILQQKGNDKCIYLLGFRATFNVVRSANLFTKLLPLII